MTLGIRTRLFLGSVALIARSCGTFTRRVVEMRYAAPRSWFSGSNEPRLRARLTEFHVFVRNW